MQRLIAVMHRRVAFAACVALLAPGAAASPPLPTSLVPTEQTGRLDSGSQVEVDCRLTDCERGLTRRLMQFGRTPGLGASLVEFRSPVVLGQPTRPQHGIGIRSHALEAALNGIGLEARHCLAPVVRMHTKLSSSFDLSGTLWVYLRCTVR